MSSQNNDNITKGDSQPPLEKQPAKRSPTCKCKGDCPRCDEKKHIAGKSTEAPKVIVVSTIALMFAIPAVAQTGMSAEQSFRADPFNHPMLPVYTMMAFIFITIIMVLITTIYLVRVIKFLVRENNKAVAAKAGVKYVAPPSIFEKIWQDLNASVPVAKEQDIDLGHSFDGIRELDNHLPPWWKGLFYGCIIWGIGYLIVYHVTDSLPLSVDEYQAELTTADEKAKALRASRPAEVIDENTLMYTADPDLIAKGKTVFVANNCGSCHRADGGGNTIGPNLTDDYWLHGGRIKNIYSTVNSGVVEKGMPAWGKVMNAADVRNVAFYIMSLQGSNPVDGKAPQGELYKPADVPSSSDSTVAIVKQ
jgi:cytochrome c oxidase cbb3-type subunit 3